MTNNPQPGDTDNELLYKICSTLSGLASGAFAPRFADTKNNLLFKFAALVRLVYP